ncbi:MAG: hypothetical protein Q9185_006875 [Variospora sp. 1 TL-2023]
MAPHSSESPDSIPANEYLELLPPATYIPGTRKARKASLDSNRRPFSASRSTITSPEDVKAVMTRSRSGSASTDSSPASSYNHRKPHFLQLVPELDETSGVHDAQHEQTETRRAHTSWGHVKTDLLRNGLGVLSDLSGCRCLK